MVLGRLPIRGIPPRSAICFSRAFRTSGPALLRAQKPSGPRNMRQKPQFPLPRVPFGGSEKPSKSEDPRNEPQKEPEEAESGPSRVEAVSAALRAGIDNPENSLVSPVHIPDDPHGVLKPDHPAVSLLANSSIIVQRQLEMMSVFLGFEQANKYVIMDPQGNHIGYLAEQENGLGGTMARQMFKTHRSFTTHVFDKQEREVLRFHRPFSWINSKIYVYDCINGTEPQNDTSTALQGTSAGSVVNQTPAQTSPLPLSAMRIIGEAQQQWAPLRRKYNLFLARDASTPEQTAKDAPGLASGDLPLSSSSKALQVSTDADRSDKASIQFALVDEPFLSWDFTLRSSDNRVLGSVNRNFGGFARELFTDTGVYALRMDAAAAAEPHTGQQTEPQRLDMTLDQRAVMLATAVSVDFDYFSRHSSGIGGAVMPFPIWLPGVGGGGAAVEGGAVAGATGIGAAEGAAGAVGGAARGAGGVGAGESGAAAAGAMAGYEAMQRGGGSWQDGVQQDQDDPWGEIDPWGSGGKGDGDAGSGDGSGGNGGGGDGDFFDFF